MLKVVCIGAGRLAHHLMPRFELAGCEIVQVYNRTPERGTSLAQKLRTATLTSSLKEIRPDADLYFLTLSDDIIPVMAQSLADADFIKGIVVHCSGVSGLDVLPFPRKGIFYPLQTFSDHHTVPWATTPILITATDPDIRTTLNALASKITESVYEVSDEQKVLLHVAAVFANNFTNHMLTLAENICVRHGLSFDILKPLIRETIEKALDMGPLKSQTGPAIRGDVHTMEKHLRLLEENLMHKELYALISESIKQT